MNTKNVFALMGTLILITFLFYGRTGSDKLEQAYDPGNYIINALDGSGTVKGKAWPWPNRLFFEQQIAFLEDNGGGVLEVYNFSLAIPRPIKIRILPKVKVPNVYAGEKAVKDAQLENERIRKLNESSKELFWALMEKRILNYTPKKSNDYSYINKNCQTILKSMKLPSHSNDQKFLFLYSDFVDHTPKSKSKAIDDSILVELSQVAKLSICYHGDRELTINAIDLPNHEEFIGVLNPNY